MLRRPSLTPGLEFRLAFDENAQDLAAQFQIRSIPTLMVFKEQIVVFSQAGALPASSLDQLIEQAKSLDMETVRTDIDNRQQAEG